MQFAFSKRFSRRTLWKTASKEENWLDSDNLQIQPKRVIIIASSTHKGKNLEESSRVLAEVVTNSRCLFATNKQGVDIVESVKVCSSRTNVILHVICQSRTWYEWMQLLTTWSRKDQRGCSMLTDSCWNDFDALHKSLEGIQTCISAASDSAFFRMHFSVILQSICNVWVWFSGSLKWEMINICRPRAYMQ